MTYEDPKKSWEIDHDWEYIGISRRDYYNNPHNKFKTYKCTQCEAFYYGEPTEDKQDLTNHISPFRPQNSGCQVIYAIEHLRRINKELKEELAEYEAAFKTINILLDRNKHESK